jgi:linoleoyl-CoA desaturase
MHNDAKRVCFLKEEGRDFTTVLRERVNQFFKEAEISTRANFAMISKSIFYVLLIALGYALTLSGIGGAGGLFLSYCLLGFAIAIGTMNIAHDALHGAYASNSFKNRLLGLMMDLSGGSSFYWKKEHTIDHHTFTNIADHDGDLAAPFVLRLCPKAPRYWFHRFQHIYAPVLYSVNFIKWIYYSDIKRIFKVIRYRNKAPGNPSHLEIFLMVAFKFVHLFLFVALPVFLLPIAWWVVVLGYLSFLATAGLTMTVIFQLAHIVEDVAFPLPDPEGKIDNSFLKHQLATTSNFAVNNWLVNFLFGGLNFQVEHHIFPHVCHTHLKRISTIVKETALEFGLPYHENATFFSAIRSHFKTLQRLGSS